MYHKLILEPFQPQPQTSREIPKKVRLLNFIRRRRVIYLGVFLAMAGLVTGGGLYYYKNAKHISGSGECVTWVKKIEGDNFSYIHKLDCSLMQRKIANSNIQAYYLDYSSEPKEGCPTGDLFGLAPPRGCSGWSGIVLANGQKYSGLGTANIQYPLGYDYCYA